MDVRVRCCSLTKPAADGSIIGETCVRNYLESEEYRLSIEGKLTLGYLTHRGRSLECLPSSVNSPKLKTTIGKDDAGLMIADGAPTYTHYVKEFYIDDVPGEGPWLCALVHIFDEDGFDHVAAENIRRLKALIRAGVKLTASLVVLAYWSGASNGVDQCSVIKSIKSLDWTCNPSFGPLARITEVIEDETIDKAEMEKEFSEIDEDYMFARTQPKEGEIKVKVFSDLSSFDCSNYPKSSKIDGQFTKLKAKQYSSVCSIYLAEEEECQKEFSVATVKERVRFATKLSPRVRFRRLILDYKLFVKSAGGVDKMDPETLKTAKSLLSIDALEILKSVTPEIVQSGKQINTVLGLSSISKSLRVAGQKMQIPYRLAMLEAQKQGFINKMRYQKIQDAYKDFIESLIEEVFGANSTNLPSEEDDTVGEETKEA